VIQQQVTDVVRNFQFTHFSFDDVPATMQDEIVHRSGFDDIFQECGAITKVELIINLKSERSWLCRGPESRAASTFSLVPNIVGS
jgi:hypothetical protein